MKHLAPAVGALVDYGVDSWGRIPGKYRVKGWLRLATPPKSPLDGGDLISYLLWDESVKQQMQWCLREDATHVALTGIGGTIAPIEAVIVTGMVAWSEEVLHEAQKHAEDLGRSGRYVF
jgi:hypothetical protein